MQTTLWTELLASFPPWCFASAMQSHFVMPSTSHPVLAGLARTCFYHSGGCKGRMELTPCPGEGHPGKSAAKSQM